MKHNITLRPINTQDLDLLYRIYASTREDELAPLDWSAEQKQAFLEMQFNAQHTFYQEQYSQAKFQIVLLNGQAVGRLYVERRADEIRIIDMSLLPDYRRQGIGSGLFADIFAQGQQAGLPVRIHVEHFNPALGLYRRLGFKKIGDTGVYFLMEWTPV